jgi:hypothetical protein
MINIDYIYNIFNQTRQIVFDHTIHSDTKKGGYFGTRENCDGLPGENGQLRAHDHHTAQKKGQGAGHEDARPIDGTAEPGGDGELPVEYSVSSTQHFSQRYLKQPS